MFVKRFEEAEQITVAGNMYHMLLPRDVSKCFEIVREQLSPGAETPLNAHDDLDQAFLILQGRGLLRVGEDTREVEPNTVAFIPRYSLHNIRSLGDVDLVYIYISVWSEGIPADRKEWRSAYKKMQEKWGVDSSPSPERKVKRKYIDC